MTCRQRCGGAFLRSRTSAEASPGSATCAVLTQPFRTTIDTNQRTLESEGPGKGTGPAPALALADSRRNGDALGLALANGVEST